MSLKIHRFFSSQTSQILNMGNSLNLTLELNHLKIQYRKFEEVQSSSWWRMMLNSYHKYLKKIHWLKIWDIFSYSIQHKKQIPGPINPCFRRLPQVRIFFTKHNHKKHLILRGMFQFHMFLVHHVVLNRACSIIRASSDFSVVRTPLESPYS